ncbi:MAG: CHAT domain-containing protein, partial [Thiomargarita sp.]|nr:CHAT domain-containing protein [Thiomargarita sp.]
MPLELNLNFSEPQHVIVSLITDKGTESTDLLNFTPPLSDKGSQHLRWYLEDHATEYSRTIDFDTAGRIVKQLPSLGMSLFNKVFYKKSALRLFKIFQQNQELDRSLTITATQPEILSLPWELLHHSIKGGNFVIEETPRISIRRTHRPINGQTIEIKPKDKLHLLFILSRPCDVENQPAKVQAVLNSLGKSVTERVAIEFLRPATLKSLRDRLDNKKLPPIDILHFDGFDQQDNLLFEKDNGETDIVAASLFAQILYEHAISLVILSTETSEKGNIDKVATQLMGAGIPFVLVIRYRMLQIAMQILFGTFYESLAQGKTVSTALDAARLALYKHTERRKLPWKNAPTVQLHDWFVPCLYEHEHEIVPLLHKKSSKPAEPIKQFLTHNLPSPPILGFRGKQRQVWDIERRFRQGARCINIHGFEGEGKTCLARETGHWLQQAGRFKRVVFVDYAHYQGLDPVSVAVSAISYVLHKNLLDADAVTRALRRVPTLLIFDNLDAIDNIPIVSNISNTVTTHIDEDIVAETDDFEDENEPLGFIFNDDVEKEEDIVFEDVPEKDSMLMNDEHIPEKDSVLLVEEPEN